jgi:hypothetical protein
VLVLTQIPSWLEVAGVALVIVGVAVHQAAPAPGRTPGQPSDPST